MSKLKVGIVGIGSICTKRHLPAWESNSDVEIVALCDIREERAQQAAKEYNVKHVFKDYKDLLNVEEIQVVDICTPNYLHSIVAVDAFKKGKHVFCEKPDAISVEEAIKMKDASEEAGKMLMVMRNNRFLKQSQYLKEFIEQGKMGEIYAAKCGWVRTRGIPGRGGWFTTKEQSGGGPLIDLGVHMIDVTMWLMGNPVPVSVVGSTFSKFADFKGKVGGREVSADGTYDVEDMATGFIKFDNGACMSIEFSWASNVIAQDKFFEILGTKAGARFHSQEDKFVIIQEENGVTVNSEPDLSKYNGGEHKAYIDHFVDCLLNGAKPIFVPEQGVHMIKILKAIYKSAETGREVLL